MLTLEEIVKNLNEIKADRKRSLVSVSMDTRINYHQVWLIATGRYANPKYQLVKKLSDYLESLHG